MGRELLFGIHINLPNKTATKKKIMVVKCAVFFFFLGSGTNYL